MRARVSSGLGACDPMRIHRSRQRLEPHRAELTAFCQRMLGASEAEDSVQETFIRAWRGFERFEGRAPLRSWLYRIARNVCLDMPEARQRRARPIELFSAGDTGAQAEARPGRPAEAGVQRSCRGRWRSRRGRRRARVRSSRSCGGVPAPAAEAARCPHPARGPALASIRGCRAPRDEPCLSQSAPSGRGQRSRRGRRPPQAPRHGWCGERPTPHPVCRCLRALRHGSARVGAPRGRDQRYTPVESSRRARETLAAGSTRWRV